MSKKKYFLNKTNLMRGLFENLSDDAKNVLMIVAGVVVVFLLYLFLFNGKQKMCDSFCPACEVKLIEQAKNGDAVAQAKLQAAMYDKDVEPPKMLSQLGPFAIFGFFLIIAAVVYVSTYFGKQAQERLQPYTSKLFKQKN